VLERKIIRRICGTVCIEGNWRLITNKEIDELIGHGDLASFVKYLRIRYLGHVERMNHSRMSKMILNAKMEGGRMTGRPRKQWLDNV
jgi:hypothetical protein